jgi:hypothetical protein
MKVLLDKNYCFNYFLGNRNSRMPVNYFDCSPNSGMSDEIIKELGANRGAGRVAYLARQIEFNSPRRGSPAMPKERLHQRLVVISILEYVLLLLGD